MRAKTLLPSLDSLIGGIDRLFNACRQGRPGGGRLGLCGLSGGGARTWSGRSRTAWPRSTVCQCE